MKKNIFSLGFYFWIFSFFFPLPMQASEIGPSYDCSKSKGLDEKIICKDIELSLLDQILSKKYKRALGTLDGNELKNQLKKSQRKWLNERGNCKKKMCLKKMYINRMDQLDNPKAKMPPQSQPSFKLSSNNDIEGELIHPGCVHELITEINGDDIVSSIHISRTLLRGCQDSNKYHQEITVNNGVGYKDKENGFEFEYNLIRQLKDSVFLVEAIEYFEGGSMGASKSILILSLKEEPLFEFSQNGEWDKAMVLKLKKLGEIFPENLEAFLKAYDAGNISFSE